MHYKMYNLLTGLDNHNSDWIVADSYEI